MWRAPLVAGNWKMNTTVPEGLALARAVAAGGRPAGVEVAILPPFPHLWPVRDVIAGTEVLLGAQDVFWERSGAFTGEVSPAMLAGWCDLVLVGHSERRAMGESAEQVGLKLRAALAEGLRVIVAVGETLDQRRAGSALDVVHRQLDAAFAGLDAAALEPVVVAYEPVWAIGTGVSATPDDAQAMCAAVRRHLGDLGLAAAADAMRVLYGGSMTADNAAALMAQPDVDGGLVGGASLSADHFARIVASAAVRVDPRATSR